MSATVDCLDRTAEDLLHLTQWLSPAFPVGGYAYSHGLEWLIGQGRVGNAAHFGDWAGDVLEFGAGWNDGLLLSLAHRSALPIAELQDMAIAMASSRERETETLEQGAAFVRVAGALAGKSIPKMPLPLAVGVCARELSLPTKTVVGQYLHAFLSNLTSIATRAVPLGQTEAQAVLASLAPAIAAHAGRLSVATVEDLGSGLPGGDLASILHEEQDVRLFRT